MDKTKPGIYKIVNLINEKVYVGSAQRTIEKRWREHKNNLKRNKGNRHLQRSWDKYGSSNFSFVVIENVEDLSLLYEREEYWINELKACDEKFGYNICPKPKNPPVCKGQTEETRAKISASKKGKPLSEAHKAALRKPKSNSENMGVKAGSTWSDVRRAAHPKHISEEHKEKIKQAHRDGKMSKPPSNKGVKRRRIILEAI
jgi:group I intron endonuclease